uniref:DREV methyltransferase n=1 Tax=Onchocerca volvulus TaxID=6282 RepID=A0A8R1XQ91_ONCVO
MFRSQRIARMLLEKEELDDRLLAGDHSEWYYIDKTAVTSYMLEKFHQFYMDEDVEIFLDNSLETSNSLCLQICYALVTSFLSVLLTKTSINGILFRGGMHLFSLNQLQEFLEIPDEWISHDKMLLDLGAGDGQITAVMARLYNIVSVTEASKVMEWRLKHRGFRVVSMDMWHQSGTYHLISALNLLDRHYNPSLLLAQLHSMTLRSKSLLLLAVVLPLHQYVEFHPTSRTNRPDIKISIKGKTFEEQANSLVTDILEPAGFELLKWGKLPYLSEGDLRRPFYRLDDAVFLLKPMNINFVGSSFSNIFPNNSLSNRDFTSL